MAGMLGTNRVIRGDSGRKLNNALTISFAAGADEPVASGLQGGADGAGGKMGMLFGFKNGGTGKHVLTGTDGTVLHVESRNIDPTIVTRPDGTAVAEIVRNHTPTTSVVRLANGRTPLTIEADPTNATDLDAFRMLLRDSSDEQIGRLDVIRRTGGWSLTRDLVEDMIWFGHAGQPLKVPFLGTLLSFDRDPTAEEGDMALAACADIALGVRPYFADMGSGGR